MGTDTWQPDMVLNLGGAYPDWDMRAASLRLQGQFAGLMARYPSRTVGHPPVGEILASSYPVRCR
ncbi:MAG TPA: hypothetical protein VL614_11390 [Acetobacteraceae bacterium]|jgi:hypothetical protein|nr:hypothetical protein [Acetobacteraceae bacterium]